MGEVRRVYVEKKIPYAVKARELKEEIGSYLGITKVSGVRVLNRYDVENLSDEVYRQALATGVQTCALPISLPGKSGNRGRDESILRGVSAGTVRPAGGFGHAVPSVFE